MAPGSHGVGDAGVRERGLVLAGAGPIVGLAGAMTVTRLMSSRLFGVAPLDITTFVIAGITLVAVAVRVVDPGVQRGAHRSYAALSR